METNNDVTVRKRADAELRDSERRYRNIFQTAGVSIWEDDFSQVQSALDDLKARGVRDFAQHFTAHRQFVRQAITMVRVVNVKPLLHHQIQRDGNGIVDLPFDHRGAWGTNMGIAQRWAGYDLCVRPSLRTGGVVIACPRRGVRECYPRGEWSSSIGRPIGSGATSMLEPPLAPLSRRLRTIADHDRGA